jgi:hypothetical protein
MSAWRFIGLIGLFPSLGGCPELSDLLGNSPAENGAPPAQNIADLSAALDAPRFPLGRVLVQFHNDAAVDADVQLTMRVGGFMVHHAARRVPSASSSVIVGPDHADSIVVEITQLKSPEPRSLPSQVYFVGLDFLPGQVLNIRIAGDPPVVLPPENTEPEPRPAPRPVVVVDAGDTVGVIEITPNQFIDIPEHPGGPLPIPSPIPPPGGVAPFPGFGGSGGGAPFPGGGAPGSDPEPAPTGEIIDVVVDGDVDPTNGNETVVPVEPGRGTGDPIQWDPSGVPPGVYLVYTDQVIDGDTVRIGPGPAVLRVNAPPVLEFLAPAPGLTLRVGTPLRVTFSGSDVDDRAHITIFLDEDMLVDGSERLLETAIAAQDSAEVTLHVDTAGWAPGVYFIGGTIDDGATRVTASTGPVTLVED